MKTTKAVLITAIGVGLTLSAGTQPGKHPGEKVELKSLPASVEEAIQQKAAGGNIVKVLREDDPDGKWNYRSSSKRTARSRDSRSIQTGNS